MKRLDNARKRPSAPSVTNVMTVDVEEHFQVHALSPWIDRKDWDRQQSRVEAATQRLLDLFAARGVFATFFVLGWVAERNPALIRRIVAEGHELASHGYDHTRADCQSVDQFREDIRKTKKILEGIGGREVMGYRAASFSISAENRWAYRVLAEEGYAYSSSVKPRQKLATRPEMRIVHRPISEAAILECPVASVRLIGRDFPCAGGAYFRFLPFAVSRWAVERVNTREKRPFVFYMHPWEIDPGQPRVRQATLRSRIRHYTNISRMECRLERLLRETSWSRLDRSLCEIDVGTAPVVGSASVS